MYIENYYIGGQEYIITFKNGTHYVNEVMGDDMRKIFSGTYEKCKNYLKILFLEYKEACMF